MDVEGGTLVIWGGVQDEPIVGAAVGASVTPWVGAREATLITTIWVASGGLPLDATMVMITFPDVPVGGIPQISPSLKVIHVGSEFTDKVG